MIRYEGVIDHEEVERDRLRFRPDGSSTDNGCHYREQRNSGKSGAHRRHPTSGTKRLGDANDCRPSDPQTAETNTPIRKKSPTATAPQ